MDLIIEFVRFQCLRRDEKMKSNQQTTRELYLWVKNNTPFYNKAVEIGSIITCSPDKYDKLTLAAEVEKAVMSLIKEVMLRHGYRKEFAEYHCDRCCDEY